jgi:ankyrin repeat protein
VLLYLLQQGGDPNQIPFHHDETAFALALKDPAVSLQHLQLMFTFGGRINVQDKYGMSPISSLANHFQHAHGQLERIEWLLDHGANVNMPDFQRASTLLHQLAIGAHVKPELVRVLLASGGDIWYKDAFGKTPLHLARSSTNEEVKRLFVNKSVQLNLRLLMHCKRLKKLPARDLLSMVGMMLCS